MAEGVETPLLGQQLLIRHGVDGMREAERGTEQEGRGKELSHGTYEWRFSQVANIQQLNPELFE